MSGLRLLPCGPGALLVEVGSVAEATRLYAAARAALAADPTLRVLDVVPGARTVLFDGVSDVSGLRTLVTRSLARGDAPGGPGSPVQPGAEVVVLPTVYDGADLEDVARRWDMTRDEAVLTHTGTTFTVAFCGFAPGFAYCTGLPADLAVPRLPTPRPRVPAGSVGVAGEFTGVYPRASPGGWRLLGRTGEVLWDDARPAPALLAPGTTVRFEAVT